MLGIGHRAFLHRVGLAQVKRLRVITKQGLVVRGHRFDGDGAIRGDHGLLRVRVVAVGADPRLQPGLQRGALLRRQVREVGAVVAARDDVQPRDRLAMQPVGGPVRRHVAAMTPDGAELLAARGLPHLPAPVRCPARVYNTRPSLLSTALGRRRRVRGWISAPTHNNTLNEAAISSGNQ